MPKAKNTDKPKAARKPRAKKVAEAPYVASYFPDPDHFDVPSEVWVDRKTLIDYLGFACSIIGRKRAQHCSVRLEVKAREAKITVNDRGVQAFLTFDVESSQYDCWTDLQPGEVYAALEAMKGEKVKLVVKPPRELQAGPVFDFLVIDGGITREFNNVQRASAVMVWPQYDSAGFSCNFKTWCEAATRATTAADVESTRYALYCVFQEFAPSKNEVVIVATDSRWMSANTIRPFESRTNTVSGKKYGTGGGLVPVEVVQALASLKAIKKAESIRVSFVDEFANGSASIAKTQEARRLNSSTILHVTDRVVVRVLGHEYGRFPRWRDVIPNYSHEKKFGRDYLTDCHVDGEALYNAVDCTRAIEADEDGKRRIVLRIDPDSGQILIKCGTSTLPPVAAAIDGPFDLAMLDAKYVLDAVRPCKKGGDVTYWSSHECANCFEFDKDDVHSQQIVMPLALDDITKNELKMERESRGASAPKGATA